MIARLSRCSRRFRPLAGFTLIELLIVIVIIGILVAIGVPAYLRYVAAANDRDAQAALMVAYKAAVAGDSEVNNARFPVASTVVQDIQTDEPAAAVTRGDCLSGVATAAPKQVQVDPSSTSSQVTLCVKSANGTIWKLTGPLTGTPTISDGSMVPLTITNAVNDAVRTAGLSGDGLPVPDSTTGIWEQATNLAVNGGAETATAPPWTANGIGSVSQDATKAKFGTKSWRYDDPTASNGSFSAGFGQSSPAGLNAAPGTAYTSSGWYLGGAGKSFELLQRQYYTDSTSGDFPSSCFTGPSNWTRYTTTGVVPVGKTLDKVDVQLRPCGLTLDTTFGTWTMWADGLQIEQRTLASPYIDTSGATASRPAGRVQVPASTVTNTQGWWAIRMRMDWPNTNPPTGSSGFRELVRWSSVGGATLSIQFRESTQKFELDKRDGGALNGDAVNPTVVAFSAGSYVTIVGFWQPGTTGISVNGAPFTTAAYAPFSPAGLDPTYNIGWNPYFAGREVDSDVVWFAAGRGTLSNADATTINGWGSADPQRASFPAAAQATVVWDGASTNGSLR